MVMAIMLKMMMMTTMITAKPFATLLDPEGTSTYESASRMNSAFALMSSLVAITTNSIARSSPSVMYAHWRMDMIAFVAAMPEQHANIYASLFFQATWYIMVI
jgi:hypothetical protein